MSILIVSLTWITLLQLALMYLYGKWQRDDVLQCLEQTSDEIQKYIANAKEKCTDTVTHYEVIVLSGSFYYAKRAFEGNENRKINFEELLRASDRVKADLVRLKTKLDACNEVE